MQSPSDDLARSVADLGVPHRAKHAFWRLVLGGADSLAAVRDGLRSPSGDVRMHCARVLDHIVDEQSLAELIALLGDADPRVRLQTVHALACDNCKDGAWCPSDNASLLPPAVDVLLHDPDRHVRAMAVELVGRWIHTDARAVAALERARDADAHPSVRKKAGWYTPGGTIYRKRQRELARRMRSTQK
jgi:HEAT repeat protein